MTRLHFISTQHLREVMVNATKATARLSGHMTYSTHAVPIKYGFGNNVEKRLQTCHFFAFASDFA